jgi:hypothetical protein
MIDQAQLSYDVRRAPALPRTSQVPLKTSGGLGAHVIHVPPAPKGLQVVLYDQYDNANPAGFATSSQDFETANDAFDDDLADDFVVPAGGTWNVESIDADGLYFFGSTGPADSFNIRFYTDSAGLPGTQVYEALGQSYTTSGGDCITAPCTFSITLTTPAVLTAGTYWVEVQARMDSDVGGQWGWTDRTVQSNSAAAWQNPNGGFLLGCLTWGHRGTDCGIDPGVPDQVFRLNGTTGGGTPTPTPTATPVTPTPTETPRPTPTPRPRPTPHPRP